MTEPTCKTCHWFEEMPKAGALPDGSYVIENSGICTINPPTGPLVYTFATKLGNLKVSAKGKITHQDSRCDEHTPKEKEIGSE